MKAFSGDTKGVYFTAFGGGLYWASSALLLSSWKPDSSFGNPSSFSSGLVIVATVALICIVFACSRIFLQSRFQKALAVAGILSTLAYTALALSGGSSTAYLAGLVISNACHHACLILFWGLNYAALSKSDAEKTVFLSLFFAFVVYLCLCSLPVGRYALLMVGMFKGIGVLPFLAGRYALPVAERVLIPQNARLLFPFYASRVFLGFAMGPLFFLGGVLHPSLPEPSVGLCLLGLVVLAVALICEVKSFVSKNSLLRMAPFLIVGFLVLPYFFGTDQPAALATAFVAIAWLSWIVLSSTQLSDIKERVGLNEAFLSFSEKAVVYFSLLLGFVVSFLVYNSFGEETRSTLIDFAPLASVYLVVLVSGFLLSNVIEKKERQRIVDKAMQLSNDHLELVFERIGDEYRLTERELEVLPYIAKGYTRAHVSTALVISNGTAKTHIAHIYDKLNIHSREELYELVEAQKRQFIDERQGPR